MTRPETGCAGMREPIIPAHLSGALKVKRIHMLDACQVARVGLAQGAWKRRVFADCANKCLLPGVSRWGQDSLGYKRGWFVISRKYHSMTLSSILASEHPHEIMSYKVYLVTSVGAPRDHHAIFVETKPDLSGQIFQVTGNIQSGMEYETKTSKQPEESATFQEKTLLGTVTAADYQSIDSVCRSIPAPPKQFEGAKRLYPQQPLRRCQEWTADAIEALRSKEIIS